MSPPLSPAMRAALAGLLLAAAPLPAPAAEREPAAESAGPFRATVVEARGEGHPLWRRWVDLDGDGRRDLVVVSAASSTPEPEEEDRIGALLSWLQVTPAFLDRRSVLVYRQSAEGLRRWGPALPLTGDTTSVDLADLDGDGRPEILFAAGYRVSAFRRDPSGNGYLPAPRAVTDATMLLGVTRAFVPGSRLILPGEHGAPGALLLSTAEGLEIRRPAGDGTAGHRADPLLPRPFRRILRDGDGLRVFEPAPLSLDGDADGTPDLILLDGADIALFRGLGGGRFDPSPVRERLPEFPGGAAGIGIDIHDVDGDGRPDLTRILREPGGEDEDGDGTGGRKKTRREKKREEGPEARVEVRRGRAGLRFPAASDVTIEIPPKAKRGGATVDWLPIDADGRTDLLVTRFETSLWQLARVLTTKKISIRVSFETMLQRPDGSFAPPAGEPFETKVLIDLRRGLPALPSRPRGDFNGDGITDLVVFDDPPEARVHLTDSRGAFGEKPALSIPLPRLPDDRALLDIEDIDGDGKSDIAFFTPDGAGFIVTCVRSGP